MSYAGKNDELCTWKCTCCLHRDKVEHVGKERKWMERIKIVPLWQVFFFLGGGGHFFKHFFDSFKGDYSLTDFERALV